MSTSHLSWTHKIDVAGNRTQSLVQAADGAVVRRLVYVYDTTSKMLSAEQYEDNGTLRHKWLYDSAGDVREHKRVDEAGSVIERNYYSYEYDTQKNWIKRVASRQVTGTGEDHSVPFEVAYRRIGYYPPVGEFQMNGGVIPGGAPKNAASQPSILSSQATKRVEPVFATAARLAHISGTVVVEITVDEEGDVLSARAISGHPLLTQGALDAAWDWKFSPMIYRGRPVKVVGAIEFHFQI